jgi:hypothetical protein
MADWLPWVAAAGGLLTALAAFVKVFFDRKNTTQTHTNALLDQYQEDRKADREERKELNGKVEKVLDLYYVERDYSAELLAWGLQGAPPPPPNRRVILIAPASQ